MSMIYEKFWDASQRQDVMMVLICMVLCEK